MLFLIQNIMKKSNIILNKFPATIAEETSFLDNRVLN